MSTRDLNKEELLQLETLIDAVGIEAVLMGVSDICGEKADHIRTNWQDGALARRWDIVAGAIGVTVPKAFSL